MNPSEMQRKAPPWRRKHCNRTPLTCKMNKVVVSEEQMKSPCTKKVERPTWAQLNKLTHLVSTKVTQTPENMLLAALMIVSMFAGIPNNSKETATIEKEP
ncbi:hypothetical protein H8957_007438 [Semnopithecus entellus]